MSLSDAQCAVKAVVRGGNLSHKRWDDGAAVLVRPATDDVLTGILEFADLDCQGAEYRASLHAQVQTIECNGEQAFIIPADIWRQFAAGIKAEFAQENLVVDFLGGEEPPSAAPVAAPTPPKPPKPVLILNPNARGPQAAPPATTPGGLPIMPRTVTRRA
jgi:hypothetical protein